MKRTLILSLSSTILATSLIAGPVPRASLFLARWDLNSDGRVSVSEVLERRHTFFVAFDADQNGALSKSEFAGIDQEAASGAVASDNRGDVRAEHISALDRDEDGRIVLEEFLSGSAAWLSGYDSDQDGVITRSDFE